MRKRNLVIIGILAVVLVLIVFFIPVSSEGYTSSSSIHSFTKYFEDANLSISGTPFLNNPVNITFSVTAFPSGAGPNMSLNISLPQGFEHVSGNLTWMGFIGPNETVNTTAVIKANQTGDFVINARAGPPPKGSIVRRSLFVSVSENTATVSTKPPICTGTLFQVLQCMRVKTIKTS